jgi:hypothetical protein
MAPGAPGLGAQDQEVRSLVLGQAEEVQLLLPWGHLHHARGLEEALQVGLGRLQDLAQGEAVWVQVSGEAAPFPAHQVEAEDLRPQGLSPGLGHPEGGEAGGAVVQAHGDALHPHEGFGEEDRDLAPVEEVAGEAAPGQGLKVGAGDHVQKLGGHA